MPDVLQRLLVIEWKFANGDPAALAELRRRIDAIGATEDFLTYTPLVEGVTFHLPNVGGGAPFEIRQWGDFERSIVGDFLGRICVDSYRDGQFLPSAIVLRSERDRPGAGFFTLAREVGLLGSRDDDSEIMVWLEQVKRARAWYRAS